MNMHDVFAVGRQANNYLLTLRIDVLMETCHNYAAHIQFTIIVVVFLRLSNVYHLYRIKVHRLCFKFSSLSFQ